MRTRRIAVAVAAAFLIAAPAAAQTEEDLRGARMGAGGESRVAVASVALEDPSGGPARGIARIRQLGASVRIEVRIEGLAPGSYDVVVAEGGSCEEPGPARGTAGPVVVDAAGGGRVVAHPDGWSVGGDDATDVVGKPVLVLGPDGNPVLCGVATTDGD